ncbi:MAG: NYN domain-containing protein [Candidatus Methylumidiphilus sp.]|nr:NYN domain-containing protein [Pseudomonadota bacterium]
MKRVIVFFDYSNFHQALNRLSRGEFPDPKRFDFRGFVETLTLGMDLIKVYFVCSSSPNSGPGQQRFFDWLDGQEYFYVKQFERKSNEQGEQREKQVDVYLATQVVALAYENAYDIAMIVSGDEDYVPAIEIVQQKGKIVVVVSALSLLSDVLRKKADRVLLIDADGALNFDNFLSKDGHYNK